ncbi:SURF1 family protein [Teredinibacter purpureus]|uniref:SURF1 family protein n=1 Tax=Teredinibacter purpureus TaxID=2731756 RepID=UPI0005F8091A|nr:SURF1 family protein [Teredinibacter purpureus]
MAGASKITFHINWKITAFSTLLLPVLLSLGFWQLSRAQEKQTLQESWQLQQALPTQAYTDTDTLLNRRIFVEGHFETAHYWLIENKRLDGQLGYHVVMAFIAAPSHGTDKALLINRGWVAAGQYRHDNPVIKTPKGRQRITGTLKIPSDSRFIEAPKLAEQVWPYRLLEVNTDFMATQLNRVLSNKIVLLDADSAGALAVSWQPINMRAEKHHGYAVQWFGMALALIVLWLLSNSNVKALLRREP